MTKSTLVLICTFLNPTTEHNFLSALGFSFLLNIHSIRAQGSSYPSFICQFNNLLKIDRSFFLIEFNISFVFTWELILKIADSTIVYESLDCTVSLGARMWKSLSRFIRHACSWCEQQRQLSICTSYDQTSEKALSSRVFKHKGLQGLTHIWMQSLQELQLLALKHHFFCVWW